MGPLDKLPFEVLTDIALFIYSPLEVDERDLLSGDGIFASPKDDREEARTSLINLGSVCRSVRGAVRPLLFRCVNINSKARADTALSADWGEHVRVMRVDLEHLAVHYEDVWETPKLFQSVLLGFTNVQHLHISIGLDDEEVHVALGAFGILCRYEASIQAFLGNLTSLGVQFSSQRGDVGFNHYALAYPFVEHAQHIRFLLVDDCDTYIMDGENPHVKFLSLIPSSLISITLKGFSFYDVKEKLGGLAHCKNIRHLFMDAPDLELDAARFCDLPQLLSIGCGKQVYLNRGTAVDLAYDCPTLVFVGDAEDQDDSEDDDEDGDSEDDDENDDDDDDDDDDDQDSHRGWIIDRFGEEDETYRYKLGDFQRLVNKQASGFVRPRRTQTTLDRFGFLPQ